MIIRKSKFLMLSIAACLAGTPALADPPPWAKGKGKGKAAREHREERHAGHDHHFGEQQRVVVREYYETQHQRGHCPPGLAKKNNGCMPPGQAKKWQVGRPLPPDIRYYEVPAPLVVQLGTPPSGYRYVRVAADILMIAVGTGIVAAAIQDLGRG